MSKPWLGKKLSEEHKERIRIGTKKHLPSTSFKKGIVPWNKGKQHLVGEKHWNWKGGISGENERIRHSMEFIIWRNEVYKRDHYTCRFCGKHCQKKDIVAHHIKLFSEFPELRFSVDNGIVLCRSCHCELHKPNE